jgi:demethylphylloquinone reductase
MSTLSRICILGGGFGGLYTALRLSRYPQARRHFHITLVDPKDHFLFTPLFYEVLTEEMQTWQVAPSFQQLLAQTGIQFCRDRSEQIDFERRQVRLQSGQILTYDRLVLAMGQQLQLPPLSSNCDHIYTFRQLEDADRLRQTLQSRLLAHRATNAQQPLQIAIVGAGPNGVELACKLADLVQDAGEITLIDRRNALLRGFSTRVQKVATRAMHDRHVRIRLNTNIQSILPKQLVLTTHDRTDKHPVDLLVWATGSQSWQWLEQLNCQQTEQGRLLTQPTLQLIDHPDVYALGDLAASQQDDNHTTPATAQSAFQQAQVVAHNIQASLHDRPLRSFRYCHLGEILTLGINCAIVSCFGLSVDGAIGFLIRRWIYLLRLPTIRHRLKASTHWIKQCYRSRQSNI